MIVVFQVPIADSRLFVGTDTGRLYRPNWPSPSADVEFIRSFGPIRARRRGGVPGWVAESEICDAHRALKIPEYPTDRSAFRDKPVHAKPLFRRFYFDGLAVGKFEIGIQISGLRLPWVRSKIPLLKLLQDLLHHKVYVRVSKHSHIECNLGKIGPHLANLYRMSTTKVSWSNASVPNWWVRAGPPMLFVQPAIDDEIAISQEARDVITLVSDYGILLSHDWVNYNGSYLRTWIHRDVIIRGIQRNFFEVARRIRIYLIRIHAEHECLRLVLQNITEKNLLPSPRSDRSNLLQFYLNKATSRISRCNGKVEKVAGKELPYLAAACDDEIRPGQQDSLLESLGKSLEELQMRPNLQRKTLDYTQMWGNTAQVIIGEEITIMRDKYSAEQVGAQGPGAHAHDMTFNQLWNQVNESIDLTSLAKELSQLRQEMRKIATDAEHDISIGSIAMAEAAAEAGDGPTALQHLAKAGKWALNAATNIGTGIAVAALKAALGI